MKKIKFVSLNKGMNKIRFINLLYDQTNLSLKEAKELKERLVDGEVIELMVDDDKVQIIISESLKFGVNVEEVS